MGAPGRRDTRGCDQARRRILGCRLSSTPEAAAFRACASGRPFVGSAAPGPFDDLGYPKVYPVTATETPAANRQPSWAGGRFRRGNRQRSRSLQLLILVGLWLPLLVAAQSTGAGAGTDRGTYPAYGYPQGDGIGFGAYPGTRAGEPSFDYPLPGPRGGLDRDPAPVLPAYPGSDTPGDWSFPSPGSSFPGFSVGRDSPAVERPKSGVGMGGEGFRFRGDKQVSDGRWRESPSTPGYRFRPMSPDELERSAGGDGWRPIRRDDRRAAERDEVGPADADAFGYQSDSWFRRYYGDRP
jgi:hypothetical protein